MRRRITCLAVGALALLVLLPAVAHAQSTIVGVVRDTSGAVLPGVTVEAASDALIEKTRSVISDGTGQYRIVDLRPGTYTVTFSLEGFQTFKREGLDLPAEFTMTINADMRVGALEETITVTGDAPIVDVQTAVHTSGAEPRSDGRDSHRPHHPGHGPADRRRQPEPARHGRRPRHAADLHVDARHDGGEQHRDGRRHDRQRPAGRRRGPELLQRRDEPGSQLPDLGHRRRHVGGRRPPEHDSARGRQPVQRRLQGAPTGRATGRRTTDSATHALAGARRPATPSTGSSTSRCPRAARSRRTSSGSSGRPATSR